jgi:uncharacterized membrane protein
MTRTRITLAGLAVAGTAIAAYLTYVHYAGVAPICSGSGSCEKVQSSSYSEVIGIPVALLGLLSYIGLLTTVAFRAYPARAAAVFLGVSGVAFSGYLTWLEFSRINAVCQWCVGSAVVMVAIAAVAVIDAVGDPTRAQAA